MVINRSTFYQVLIILATISCSREAEVVQNISAASSEIKFTAQWADNKSLESRTAIQEDGTSIWWSIGEEINVFFASGAEGKFTSTNTEPQATATFRGTISGFVGGIEQDSDTPTTWAVYPYSADNCFDSNSVTLTLPSEQHATEGTFADKFFPAIARTQGLDLAFYNVCGGVRFSVSQPGITSLIFKSNDGSPMAGKVQVGFGSDNKPEIQEVIDSVDFVKVIAPDGGFVPGNYYFAAMIPQAHVEGIAQTFLRGEHVQYKALSKSITVKRSILGTLEDMDCGLVTGVTLYKTELEIKVGNTAVLQATVSPATATNKSVEWSSSNTIIATVSPDGAVTAVSSGIAVITVTTVDGGFAAECTVTVVVPVTGVALDKTALTLYEGASATLTATVAPSSAANKNVTWTSSDAAVAAVSKDGVVTAVSSGIAVITVTTVDGGFAAECTVTVVVPVTGVSLDKTALTLCEGASATLTATVTPSTAANKSVTWTSSNTDVATVNSEGKVTGISAGTAAITATTVDGGFTAECTVTVKAIPPMTDLGKTFVPVDLGMPSGLKWASFNLGATKPEEYGDYFAWGETKPKEDYSWSTYKWCKGSSSTMTKYCSNSSYGYNGYTDNNTILDPEDDAAAVALGGSWRMATYAEWNELKTKCTWTWTTQNGINGRLVTGPNGNSIFLPAAGYRNGASLNYAGSIGGYWSSSLCTGYPSGAYYVNFDSDNVRWLNINRYLGRSVRPVSE